MGINLGRRLLTAAILISIVWTIGAYAWPILNFGFPLVALYEFHALAERILDHMH